VRANPHAQSGVTPFMLTSKILKMGGTGWGRLSVLELEKKRPATWPAVI